jgi:S1-C subfamily serine protease
MAVMPDPESALESAFADVRPSDRVERSILAAIRSTPQTQRRSRVRAWAAAGIGVALAATLLLAFVFPPWGTHSPAERAPVVPHPLTQVAGVGHGYVGFTAMPVILLTPKQRALWSVKADSGVVAVRVFKGSPAEKAGLHNGDVLLTVAGQEMPSTKDIDASKPDGARTFADAFARISSIVRTGSDVELVVARDGKRATLMAVAVDLEAMRRIVAASGEEDEGDEGDEEDGPTGTVRPPGKPPK